MEWDQAPVCEGGTPLLSRNIEPQLNAVLSCVTIPEHLKHCWHTALTLINQCRLCCIKVS